jgi:transposase
MDKTQGIEQLFATGMSIRQIARTLGINRKTVDRHLAAFGSKGATAAEAPTGEAPTGSDDSKGAKAPTGSDTILLAAEAARAAS